MFAHLTFAPRKMPPLSMQATCISAPHCPPTKQQANPTTLQSNREQMLPSPPKMPPVCSQVVRVRLTQISSKQQAPGDDGADVGQGVGVGTGQFASPQLTLSPR